MRIGLGDEGPGQVVITLPEVELEEFASALQAFVDRRWRPVEESPAEDRAEEAPLDAVAQDRLLGLDVPER